MKDSLFFHPLMKPVYYRHHSFLQVTGLNLKVQYYIQQVIEWSVLGHRYTEKQIEDLNQEELSWETEGKKICKSHYDYLTLSNREDLLFHLSPKKGSLLSYYLSLIQNKIEISDYIMQMNTLLDKITLTYNLMNEEQSINLTYQMKPIQIRDINSTYIESFIVLKDINSLEFMSNADLVTEFIKILEVVLKQSEKYYLLKIENLITLLDEVEIKQVLNKIYYLSVKYQLQVINFTKNEHELLVNENSVNSILICGDVIEQLEDYLHVESYIQRNYPKIHEGCKYELLHHIQKISPYLLSKRGSYFVKEPTNQVIFVLLNQGMNFFDYSSLNTLQINKLEWNFLEDNLYKKL